MCGHRGRQGLNIRVNCDQFCHFDAVQHYAVEDVGARAANTHDFYVDRFACGILSIIMSIELHHND